MASKLHLKPIVERADDLLANPGLRLGKGGPRGWQCEFVECDAGVFAYCAAGLVIKSTGQGFIDLSQTIRAHANVRYRLDVHAEAHGRAGKKCIAYMQARFVALRAGEEIRSFEPGVMRVGADGTVIHRAIFQCPERTGRLRVGVRIRAAGPIVVSRVRLVECGDYLPAAHPLACPPEPWRERPGCLPEGVLLCDGRRDSRPMLGWLREVFGRANVRRPATGQLRRLLGQSPGTTARARRQRFGAAGGSCMAVIVDLPAEQAPSLRELLRWSDSRIVIASLETFAGAAQREGLRRVRLQDRVSGLDMPAGRIALAGYHTRGFGLADAVPYAWNDGQDDFAHRYLVLSKEAREQLKEMGIHPSIVTETGQAETKNQPVVLYRAGARGALIVMDPDGLERPSAGEDVPRVFDLLWRNALGRDTVTLGQFAAPALHYQGLMTDLVEVARHFDMLDDLSVRVRLAGRGNPPPIWMLPSQRSNQFAQRPSLFIRTGFSTEDWPGVYGLVLWLKRLVLKSRVNEPAARLLLDRLCVVAWPISQPGNWRGCPEGVTEPKNDLPAEQLAGLIDLAVGDEPHTVILVPDRAGATLLQRSLGTSWPHETEVVIAPQGFADELLVRQRGPGQIACKVLLPGVPRALHANSPVLTDLAATLLERLAYGAIGWIVPNRDWRVASVRIPATGRAVGRLLEVDPEGHVQALQAPGRRPVVLSAGAVLIGLNGPSERAAGPHGNTPMTG